jgi:hypothetical protein
MVLCHTPMTALKELIHPFRKGGVPDALKGSFFFGGEP